MSNKPDGGLAFPSDELDFRNGHYEGRYEVTSQFPGMTLRDYFAGQAMAAIIAHPGMEPDDCDRDGCAELAVGFADALIARLITA